MPGWAYPTRHGAGYCVTVTAPGRVTCCHAPECEEATTSHAPGWTPVRSPTTSRLVRSFDTDTPANAIAAAPRRYSCTESCGCSEVPCSVRCTAGPAATVVGPTLVTVYWKPGQSPIW